MRRAVFDTTVLISAFLRPGGLADELLTLAGEGQFELILSSAIIIETWRKLISSDHIRARYPFSDERVHIFERGSPAPSPRRIRSLLAGQPAWSTRSAFRPLRACFRCRPRRPTTCAPNERSARA